MHTGALLSWAVQDAGANEEARTQAQGQAASKS